MSVNKPWEHRVEYNLETDSITVDGKPEFIKVYPGSDCPVIGCTSVSFDALKKIYGDMARRVINRGFSKHDLI